MQQNLNPEKTTTGASQQTGNTTGGAEDEHKKLDDAAMKAATRAKSRLHDNEDTAGGATEFTK